jgi:hypothetical protein
MMRARLVFFGPYAEKIAQALEPDNLPGMSMAARGGRLALEFSSEKMGTLLATLDDLLMNIKIAEETFVSAEDI